MIKSDGTAIRSYMFMGDLIWWLLKLLLDGKSGEAYNVGSDQPVSILELALKVAQISQSRSEVVVQGQASHSVGVPVRNAYFPSIEKANEAFDLQIYTDLEASMKLTIEGLK